MSSVLIEGRALAFASFAVNPTCLKQHLRGIHVEYRDGAAVCIALDGIMLLFARSSVATDPFEAFTINFRQASRLISICRKWDAPSVRIERKAGEDPVWSCLRSNGTVMERGFMAVLDADVPFPDWRVLLPQSPLPVSFAPVAVAPSPLRWLCRAVTNYLGEAPGTLRLVSTGAGCPVVALIAGNLNVGGLILTAPQNIEAEIEFPDWAMIDPSEPATEVKEDAA